MPAKEYNKGIRAHWAVEAMHYVKDVTFGEDASLIRTKRTYQFFYHQKYNYEYTKKRKI